jgi:hypothetical protein
VRLKQHIQKKKGEAKATRPKKEKGEAEATKPLFGCSTSVVPANKEKGEAEGTIARENS